MKPRCRLATLVVLACAALPASAFAQYYPTPPPADSSTPPRGRVELTGIAGYQINSDVDTTGGHLGVSDTEVYGAALGFETRPNTWTEILWLYSDPTVTASGTPLLAGSSSFHVPTHYFQVGGTSGIRRDRLHVFAAGTLGAAVFMPGTLRYANGSTVALGDTWRFGFTLGAGLKVDLVQHVAIRFDARVAAPVYFSSGSFYAGSGGAGIAVSGGIPIWQWNFLGGLVVIP